jgi:hypothetical protein
MAAKYLLLQHRPRRAPSTASGRAVPRPEHPTSPASGRCCPRPLAWLLAAAVVVLIGWLLLLSDATTNCRPSAKEPSSRQLPRQAGAGRQPERTAQAEAAGAGIRDAAREAAARQGRDGRAAVRHQPGRPGPRPAVRALQARAGAGQGLLRRAAHRHSRHRPLPRHRILRRRRGQPVAHRHAAEPGHRPGRPRDAAAGAVDGSHGAHLPLPRRHRDGRSKARPRPPRPPGARSEPRRRCGAQPCWA